MVMFWRWRRCVPDCCAPCRVHALLDCVFSPMYIYRLHTCFTYNTIPIYLTTYFSLLLGREREVVVGTRSIFRFDPDRCRYVSKTQKLFIRTQHTSTRESLQEKMAGNPKTSEARREESQNWPNPYFSRTTNWSKSLSFSYLYSLSWSGTRGVFGWFEPNKTPIFELGRGGES